MILLLDVALAATMLFAAAWTAPGYPAGIEGGAFQDHLAREDLLTSWVSRGMADGFFDHFLL